nr:DNA ligase 1-like isoform X1 [Ipomoea batatas]
MGEGDTVSELPESTVNGNAAPEEKSEVSVEKDTGDSGVKEMEEDSKQESEKVDADKMDVDEGQPTAGKGSKKNAKSKSNSVEKDKKKKKAVEAKKEKEPRTPMPPTIDRPVRERKSVERLVASIEKDAVKEFRVEKGRGTALKDIPNVAYKLSRKKTEDSFKMLHSILFGRRGKAAQFKNHLSRFSGFVWHDNEEKQRMKVKEKFDKCVKEKLLEFCDILDIPVTKATSKKEDVLVKLMEFLEAPHAMTSELLAEKEQSSKGKRKRPSNKSGSSASGSSKGSAKSRKTESASKKGEKKKDIHESDNESEEEPEHEEKANGVSDRSDDEMSDHADSDKKDDDSEDEPEEVKKKKPKAKKSVPKESEDESVEDKKSEERKPKKSALKESDDESEEEEKPKKKQISKKSSSKKESAGKSKTTNSATPKKSAPPPKKTPTKTSSQPKANDVNDASPKASSKKKKTEAAKEKSSNSKKPAPKETKGKKVVKAKEQPKEDKIQPTDDELRESICEILKEVDFNTATFTDILKQLELFEKFVQGLLLHRIDYESIAKQYDTELAPRKASIKRMIQDELTKLADEGDDEEDDANAVKDEMQASSCQGAET